MAPRTQGSENGVKFENALQRVSEANFLRRKSESRIPTMTFSEVYHDAVERLGLQDSATLKHELYVEGQRDSMEKRPSQKKKEFSRQGSVDTLILEDRAEKDPKMVEAAELLQDGMQGGVDSINYIAEGVEQVRSALWKGTAAAVETAATAANNAVERLTSGSNTSISSGINVSDTVRSDTAGIIPAASRYRRSMKTLLHFISIMTLAAINFIFAFFKILQKKIMQKRESETAAVESRTMLRHMTEAIRHLLTTLYLSLQGGLVEGRKTLGFGLKSKSA